MDNQIRCRFCGEVNDPDKDGSFRKNCWVCKKPLDGSATSPSPAAPEPEIDLIGNDPLSWALQELMGLSDKFGRQIYTVSRLFAAIRTKRDRSGGVCVCNRADQPKPERAEGGYQPLWFCLDASQGRGKCNTQCEDCVNSLYEATPSPSSTPTALGSEGEEKKLPPCGCTSGEDCNGDCLVPEWIAERLLKIRDAFALGNIDEAYHWLYKIADQDQNSFTPWLDFEERTGYKQNKPLPSLDSAALAYDEAYVSNLRACLAAEKKLVAYWKGKADGRPCIGESLEKVINAQHTTDEPSADIPEWIENELRGLGFGLEYWHGIRAKNVAVSVWRKSQGEIKELQGEIAYVRHGAREMQKFQTDQLRELEADGIASNERIASLMKAIETQNGHILKHIEHRQELTTERDSYRVAMEDVVSRIEDVTEYRSFDGTAHIVLRNLANLITQLLAKYPQTKQ